MTTLRQAVQEYVQMRRDLGFKLQEAGKGLVDFMRVMEQHRASHITQALALAWAQQPPHAQPAHWAQRLTFVRGFARYRSATDPRTQIPALSLLPFRPKRARPYLYSNAEIRNLLRAALALPCRYERGKLRPWVYYCLLGLLSVSGLRVGEARNLELQDVDLQRPVSPYLFVSRWGHQLDGADIRRTFYALSWQVGLRGPSDSHGPRLHDLRHRFATNTLVRWYRSNQDPERKLPLLSAYLGHVHVADTQWYLSGSPELMREAMQRLEHRWEDQP